jgi:hypothetical protein
MAIHPSTPHLRGAWDRTLRGIPQNLQRNPARFVGCSQPFPEQYQVHHHTPNPTRESQGDHAPKRACLQPYKLPGNNPPGSDHGPPMSGRDPWRRIQTAAGWPYETPTQGPCRGQNATRPGRCSTATGCHDSNPMLAGLALANKQYACDMHAAGGAACRLQASGMHW